MLACLTKIVYETTDPEYPLDGTHDSDNTTGGRPACVAAARCILLLGPVGADIPRVVVTRVGMTTDPRLLPHTAVSYRQIG